MAAALANCIRSTEFSSFEMENFLELSSNFTNRTILFADCYNFDSSATLTSSSARKFVVYDEESGGGKDCDSAGAVSTLTFLNFVIGSLSLAASLVSNTNSNSNNNNNNNNDKNNNDNNINIGNSNNNINSQNQLMFLPMVGRSFSSKSRLTRRSIFYEKDRHICEKHRQGTSWIGRCVIRSIEFFVRLESCRKSPKRARKFVDLCLRNEICSEKKFLSNVSDLSDLLVLSHLAEGAAKIVGLEFEEVDCEDIK